MLLKFWNKLKHEKTIDLNDQKTAKIYWIKCGRNGKNFGDWITSYIYEKILEKKPIWSDKKKFFRTYLFW